MLFIDMVTGFVFVMADGLLIVAPLQARHHPTVVLGTDGKDNATLTAAEREQPAGPADASMWPALTGGPLLS
jgi:hypothetical protein